MCDWPAPWPIQLWGKPTFGLTVRLRCPISLASCMRSYNHRYLNFYPGAGPPMHLACPNRSRKASFFMTGNDEHRCRRNRLRTTQVMSRSHRRHPGVIVDAPGCSLWIFFRPSENHVFDTFVRVCVFVPGRSWSLLVSPGRCWSLKSLWVVPGPLWFLNVLFVLSCSA